MGATLSQISIKKGERAVCLGASGTGKSTLEEYLILQFHREFRNSRILIVDTKPRFRAEWLPNGLPAARLYKRWDHGAAIPGSILIQRGANPRDALNAAWRHGRIAIAQIDSRSDIGWVVDVISAFLKDARASRPQLVCIDEGLDFFHTNSVARGGDDAILRIARAGRERSCSLLLCSQRSKGIPAQTVSEVNKAYIFRLDYKDDMTRLIEMSYPGKEYPSPEDDWLFLFWSKENKQTRKRPVLMKLNLGE